MEVQGLFNQWIADAPVGGLWEEEEDNEGERSDEGAADEINGPPVVVDGDETCDDDAKGNTRTQGGVVDPTSTSQKFLFLPPFSLSSTYAMP